MPYILRTLSIRDVVRALKQRKVGLALDISKNLCSNVVNTARFRLRLRPQRSVRRTARRWS